MVTIANVLCVLVCIHLCFTIQIVQDKVCEIISLTIKNKVLCFMQVQQQDTSLTVLIIMIHGYNMILVCCHMIVHCARL